MIPDNDDDDVPSKFNDTDGGDEIIIGSGELSFVVGDNNTDEFVSIDVVARSVAVVLVVFVVVVVDVVVGTSTGGTGTVTGRFRFRPNDG